MDQPQGFVQEGCEHLKCKLRKAIYGLHQTGRTWYKDIHATFKREGFTRSHVDQSLYIKQASEDLLIVIIYVDDLIIFTSHIGMIKELKFRLEEEYDMSDLGELHFFLVVHIERNRTTRTITMHQRNYSEEVLERFGMEGCKPIGTLFDTKLQLLKLSDEDYH